MQIIWMDGRVDHKPLGVETAWSIRRDAVAGFDFSAEELLWLRDKAYTNIAEFNNVLSCLAGAIKHGETWTVGEPAQRTPRD